MEIHCEWGEQGIRLLSEIADVLVVVDVLSFCTTVDIATSREVHVYPVAEAGERADALARKVGAALAGPRGRSEISLSPVSFLGLRARTRIVLPSVNGAMLSRSVAPEKTILAGCLRNARAIGSAISVRGGVVGVVPAGERWPDGSLRFALEDWLGVGAIVDSLKGTVSPEAEGAAMMFRAFKSRLTQVLQSCVSGRELIEGGFGTDVLLAAELNASDCTPVLKDGAYCAGG